MLSVWPEMCAVLAECKLSTRWAEAACLHTCSTPQTGSPKTILMACRNASLNQAGTFRRCVAMVKAEGDPRMGGRGAKGALSRLHPAQE